MSSRNYNSLDVEDSNKFDDLIKKYYVSRKTYKIPDRFVYNTDVNDVIDNLRANTHYAPLIKEMKALMQSISVRRAGLASASKQPFTPASMFQSLQSPSFEPDTPAVPPTPFTPAVRSKSSMQEIAKKKETDLQKSKAINDEFMNFMYRFFNAHNIPEKNSVNSFVNDVLRRHIPNIGTSKYTDFGKDRSGQRSKYTYAKLAEHFQHLVNDYNDLEEATPAGHERLLEQLETYQGMIQREAPYNTPTKQPKIEQQEQTGEATPTRQPEISQ